jgi:MYXO-CTERM domain-containing protein
MRSRFAALVAALVLAVGTTAKAEVYTMYTAPTPDAASVASNLGLNLNISNLIVVPSGNAAGTVSGGFIVGGLTGSTIVDMNLDASDSGTLYITSSSLSLSSLSVTQSGTLFGIFPYSISLTSTPIGVNLSAGPITVTNGNFSITSATPGSLALNSGSLNYNISIAALGINEVGSIDLGASPISVDFSSLGAVTIPGTADDSAAIGVDTVNFDGHTLGGPGLTGTSVIDDDGSELTVDFSGITVASSLAINSSTNLPITITLTGGVRVGVPEAGSMTLVGLAGVAGLALIRRRRSA